ncbi:tetratricopeptide repeat-containing glycosyltransferase family protein [Phenylobacterium sp.]|uniref:tetratricopeptide repeat-containing glycosyltransferase family protein n=1 Tax=Phenylobacterium sp. TaxID=1871053 RepID=UPI00120F0296|nr:tetratricopeptide repeat-containing glycosyltransferase family protein [Phenylobacterium sp.]THD68622.1 MAG: tetratricopeptide repeat protein [Phenylobacterium sp.]
MASDADVPGQIAELITLGVGLLEAGNLKAAADLFTGLRAIDPANPEISKQLGIVAATSGDFPAAIPFLLDALAARPDDILAHNVLSVCRFETGDFEGALGSADRALALLPRFAPAHNNRGNALWRLGRLAEGLKAFQAAKALTPEDAALHVNIANIERDLGQTEAALQSLDRALQLDRNIPQAYNRGNVLQDLGRHEEAVRSYDEALKLEPNSVSAHWNRALCNLLMGRFEDGWRDYEWRWRRDSPENVPRNFPAPLWLGQAPLAGKTILLHGEQGLGDCIQFIRYAPLVAARGATVLVEVVAPLVDLFTSVEGVSEVFRRGGPLPAVDFQCPLMSLPLALGDFGGAPDVPTPYLAPSPEKRAAWRDRLGSTERPRVGLVGSGSPTHRADHLRSVPLADLAATFPVGPQYHLLQRDLTSADRAALGELGGIAFWGDHLGDFTDTAALCELMDLVISVDTSVAHLAGALAAPVRILVAFDPDWRWGRRVETSPWYPSARILRQAARGDWSAPLALVAREITELDAARR